MFGRRISFLAIFSCLVPLFSIYGNQWQKPEEISAVYRDTSSPQIAVDVSGNAFAVWSRFNGENLVIQASHYEKESGTWMAINEVVNLSHPEKSAFGPSIGIDLEGNACVVWSGFDGEYLIVQATHFNRKKGKWSDYSDLVDLSRSGKNGVSQQVEMDDAGNALAIWRRYDGSHFRIETARYDGNSGTWTQPDDVKVLSRQGKNGSFPKLAVDHAGNAVAAWLEIEGEEVTIQAARFCQKKQCWSELEQLADLSEKDQRAVFRQVAIDAQGNAIAVWEKYDGKRMFIQASYFDLAKMKWSTPDEVCCLSEKDGNAFSPRVALDSKGNAIAVWEKFEGNFRVIQAARFVVKSFSWTLPTNLSEVIEAGEHALGPQIAIDSQGNAMVVWRRFDEICQIIQASRFDVRSEKWTDLKQVYTLSGEEQDAFSPQVALDGKGNAFAVWRRSNGENFVIQASYFDLDEDSWTEPSDTPDLSDPVEDASNPGVVLDEDGEVIGVIDTDTQEEIPSPIITPSPPQLLRAVQKVNRHPSWSERYNILTWRPSLSFGITEYRIYRNGSKKPIGRVKEKNRIYHLEDRTEPLKYEDHHRIKGKEDEYKVVAVNRQGIESVPSMVKVGGKK